MVADLAMQIVTVWNRNHLKSSNASVVSFTCLFDVPTCNVAVEDVVAPGNSCM